MLEGECLQHVGQRQLLAVDVDDDVEVEPVGGLGVLALPRGHHLEADLRVRHRLAVVGSVAVLLDDHALGGLQRGQKVTDEGEHVTRAEQHVGQQHPTRGPEQAPTVLVGRDVAQQRSLGGQVAHTVEVVVGAEPALVDPVAGGVPPPPGEAHPVGRAPGHGGDGPGDGQVGDAHGLVAGDQRRGAPQRREVRRLEPLARLRGHLHRLGAVHEPAHDRVDRVGQRADVGGPAALARLDGLQQQDAVPGLPHDPEPAARRPGVPAQDRLHLGRLVRLAHVEVERGAVEQVDLVQRRDGDQGQTELLRLPQQRPDRSAQVGQVDAVGGPGVVGGDRAQLSDRREHGDLLAVVATGVLQRGDVVPAGAALDPVLLGAALERAHQQRGWERERPAGQRGVGCPDLDLEGQRERLPGVWARCR